TFQKGQENGLTLQEEKRGYSVLNGDQKFDPRRKIDAGTVDFKLRVDKLSASDGTAVVQIDLTPRDRDDAFNKALEAADPNAQPALVDSNGTRYPAAGWVYKDPGRWWVRYDQQHPMEKLSEMPTVGRSSTDKELKLIFVVSVGVELTDFKIGDNSLG